MGKTAGNLILHFTAQKFLAIEKTNYGVKAAATEKKKTARLRAVLYVV